MKLKIIKTQKQFDKLASVHCEANNGCNTELYNLRESEKPNDYFDYIDKIDEKIDEYTYLEIFSL